MYRRGFKDSLAVLHKDCPDINTFVYGESEETIRELLENQKPRGIGYKTNGSFIKTGWRKLINNLDDLPFPNLTPDELNGKKWAYLESARGCAYNCSFCSERLKWSNPGKRNYRYKTPQRVLDEIEYFYSHGIKNLRFTDSTLTLNPTLEEILNKIIERDLGPKIRWSAFVRVNEILKAPLEKMVKSGCETLLIGFETGSQKILDEMNKGYKKEQAYQAVSKLKSYGIKIRGSWIISPSDTEEDFQDTLEFAKSLQLDANAVHIYEDQQDRFRNYKFSDVDFQLDMPNKAFSELAKSLNLRNGSSEMHYIPRLACIDVDNLSERERKLVDRVRRFYAEVQRDENYDKLDKYDRFRWRENGK